MQKSASTKESTSSININTRDPQPLVEIEEDANITPISSHPFLGEFERLQTFPLRWNHFHSKRDLAKHGFYFAFASRFTTCVFCDYGINVDDNEDSLPNLHTKLSPRCDFAQGRDVSRNIPLGDTSDYRYEKNRLISFLGADWYAPVDPGDLAKWGFYWTGVADVGRCNFCRLEVRGWEPDDRGQSEHLRWNPHCPFMQQRSVGNVILGEEESAGNVVSDDVSTVINSHLATELGVMLTAPPRHPEHASLTARLASYGMWPLSMRQRPDQLAESGFYYIGKGDRVICFQCGGGLKDWGQTDLPWVEHAVWFPRCAYLFLKKGREFVAQVQALKHAQLGNQVMQALVQSNISCHQPALHHVATNQQQDASTPMNEAAALPSSTEQGSLNNDSNTSNQPEIDGNHDTDPEENYSSSRMCKVCYEKELGIVFLPCGHMATCADCAPQLSSCPICRARTSAYVRAYLP